MSSSDYDTQQIMEDLKVKYNEYVETQKNFQPPQAYITIENELDDITKVYIEVQYKQIEYSFRSIEEKDTTDIYKYLYSQSSVRQKYADGNTMSIEATTTRVNTLVNRFRNKKSPLYLYSGFTVYDSQTETFLGLVTLGGGIDIGTAEMAFLNRSECWSRPPSTISNNTLTNNNQKIYSGIGTVEVSTLIQYAQRLKQDGYQVNGHPLKSVVATARIDNEGSWKSCAKAGMTIFNIDTVSRYGKFLRYQLKKHI